MMMKTIKRYIAFLLCIHTVLFVIFQVSPVVKAENGMPESEVGVEASSEEMLESESTEESSEEALESEEITEEVSSDEAESSETSEKENIDTSEEENISLVDEEELVEEEPDAEEPAEEQSLTWMSYADYKAAEAARAWNDPELFVGQTAIFNENWGFFFWESGFEATADEIEDDYEDGLSLDCNEFLDENGKSIQVVITDYFTDSNYQLWYKVEAAEGYTLPDGLEEATYVMYTDMGIEESDPALLMMPLMGTFIDEQVYLQNETMATSDVKLFDTTELPDFFEVTFLKDYELLWQGYDLGDISSWGEKFPVDYHYVSEESVVLIPAEVSRAYKALLACESTAMYEAILSHIPEEITSQFTSKHIVNLEAHAEHLQVIENVKKDATVTIGNVNVPVTVHGKIPMDATLSVEAVASETVMAEGFDIKDAYEIVSALDIKILDANGVEWQPDDGQIITVSIGMAALGYEDGQIFRLHHKHGDDITVYEVFVVMDGKITLGTSGFSLYVISDYEDFSQTNPGSSTGTVVNLNNGSNAITLEVGQTVVYYFNPTNGEPNSDNSRSTWWVTDPEGAIYYELFSSNTPGTNGVNAKWIRVTALKETDQPVKLEHLYVGNNTVNRYDYDLSITVPKASNTDLGGYRLYVKDTVNISGVISATLVDTTGKEITAADLKGEITYSWVRDDGAYIIPTAYKEEGKSIDICVDHAGLLQNRLTNVTYTVTATLPNGVEKTASYTVYYQSEILNTSFESPVVPDRSYTFLTNGWPGLYWKTTSPGEENDNLSKDVEFARYTENGNNIGGNGWGGGTSFYPNNPSDGEQFAELNAEKFGALYQDIITAPGEDVSWKFEHAKRNTDITYRGEQDEEAMFLIMGPTEYAQEITNYTKITALIENILEANGGREEAIAKMAGNKSISYTDTITRDGKTVNVPYQVWYHNADRQEGVTASEAWTTMEGSYTVPSGQYRTRLFFVTDPGIVQQKNYGNLIDSAQGGQYKKYLIEYYEQTYVEVDGSNVMQYTHMVDANGKTYDETGVAIMYSSVKLENFKHFEEDEHDLLAEVLINGENSPYNIKYSKDPCLFIEKYSTTKEIEHFDPSDPKPNNYDEYDIVMQVFFRDTIIAVQKWVEFPTVMVDGKEVEALTAVQKQSLIDALIAANGNGYEADFLLDCNSNPEHNNKDGHFGESLISIVKNDPYGWYTGYIPIGDNPEGDHNFKLTEAYISPLVGLEIDKVTFEYFQFRQGERVPQTPVVYKNVALEEEIVGEKTRYKLVNLDGTDDKTVAQNDIILDTVDNDKDGNIQKLAEIKVTNTYKEKLVKYNYVSVGKGKIAVQDTDKTLTTSDYETFAYYSGKQLGVKPQADTNYTFAGWYLDEDCTRPVDENHGYVDAQGGFIPNKAKTISDNVLEVTYYAKFSIGSLRIIREHAEPGQVFVYEVKDATGKTMYVSVVIGEDGTGTTEIVNASFGDNNDGLDYTVTQLNDWSWRYKDENEGGKQSITQTHKETEGLHGAQNMTTVFTFPVEQKGEESYWLNGNSAVEKNIYGGGVN